MYARLLCVVVLLAAGFSSAYAHPPGSQLQYQYGGNGSYGGGYDPFGPGPRVYITITPGYYGSGYSGNGSYGSYSLNGYGNGYTNGYSYGSSYGYLNGNGYGNGFYGGNYQRLYSNGYSNGYSYPGGTGYPRITGRGI